MSGTIHFYSEPPMDPEPQYVEDGLHPGAPHLYAHCEDCGKTTPFAEFYEEWDPVGLVACVVCRRVIDVP